MKSIVKTVGSFDKVLASCKMIGERYQPKTTELSITAMSDMLQRSQQTTQAVTVTRSAYRLAVSNRRESFAGIPKLAVRIVRMLSSSGGSPEQHQIAIAIKDQLQASARKRKSEVTAKPEERLAPARRSATRRHFENQMETFANLIQVAEDMGTYDPNETDLKISTLKATLADLRSKSHAANLAAIAYDHERNIRKQLIYGPKGVSETIHAVKDYVRAAFGSNSPEFSKMTKAK